MNKIIYKTKIFAEPMYSILMCIQYMSVKKCLSVATTYFSFWRNFIFHPKPQLKTVVFSQSSKIILKKANLCVSQVPTGSWLLKSRQDWGR